MTARDDTGTYQDPRKKTRREIGFVLIPAMWAGMYAAVAVPAAYHLLPEGWLQAILMLSPIGVFYLGQLRLKLDMKQAREGLDDE